MSKVSNSSPPNADFSGSDPWQTRLSPVVLRFNQEYQGDPIELPSEVESMPIFHDRVSGALQASQVSPFWEIAKPKKNQRCLDIGCGVSFLVYPWRDWGAYFYGQEISAVARDALNSRGPQLNSKLFKGVCLGPAHRLSYGEDAFDLAIATGFSCYYPLAYWTDVLAEVKRVLKPDGSFVFDVVNPEATLAENWGILEMYLGTEVFLEPIPEWEKLIKASGCKILKRSEGKLFSMYKVKFE